jgi:hypothetical protein
MLKNPATVSTEDSCCTVTCANQSPNYGLGRVGFFNSRKEDTTKNKPLVRGYLGEHLLSIFGLPLKMHLWGVLQRFYKRCAL